LGATLPKAAFSSVAAFLPASAAFSPDADAVLNISASSAAQTEAQQNAHTIAATRIAFMIISSVTL